MRLNNEAPEAIRNFLIYHESIKGHSKSTIDEYYLDLRNFFRFIKLEHGLCSADTNFDDIPINDVDIKLISSVTLNDVYAYLVYLSRHKVVYENTRYQKRGLSASSRARKVATLRSFYKYLTVTTKQLDSNPIEGLESPKKAMSLPRHLSLAESKKLLSAVSGINKERDYCIICIFLNCGLRISEIVSLDLSDIHENSLRVTGKGNKERTVFLNDACIAALNDYLIVRKDMADKDCPALFVSTRRKRLVRESVHAMVKKTLKKAGLDSSKYSSHKLRHTAATLMLQHGVDVRTLQEVLGHEHLNTTQIYAHVDNAELRLAAAANPLANFDPDNTENNDK
ncbi:MAG: tyrosine recombinase XerC [Ruminococcaceae bacterium]|nr:tyrosine recombinase XerC [Oscillospiraceae bacterium]